MQIIIARKNGIEHGELSIAELDADLNGKKDFLITVPLENKDEILNEEKSIWFIPGTEIGGVIGKVTVSTKMDTIELTGYCWRGMMSKKVISPDVGKDYKTISGDISECLSELIDGRFSGIIKASEKKLGVYIDSFQFDRNCTLYDGIVKMLKNVGFKMELKYLREKRNLEVSASKIIDYSEDKEFVENTDINITIKKVHDGTNHLIVLGKGRLKDRTRIDLFVDRNGRIGHTQHYFGIDEIEETYENSNEEDGSESDEEIEELEQNGIKKLEGLMSKDAIDIEVKKIEEAVGIGDVVGGRERLTNTIAKEAIGNIIVKFKDGEIEKQYKTESEV